MLNEEEDGDLISVVECAIGALEGRVLDEQKEFLRTRLELKLLKELGSLPSDEESQAEYQNGLKVYETHEEVVSWMIDRRELHLPRVKEDVEEWSRALKTFRRALEILLNED